MSHRQGLGGAQDLWDESIQRELPGQINTLQRCCALPSSWYLVPFPPPPIIFSLLVAVAKSSCAGGKRPREACKTAVVGAFMILFNFCYKPCGI